MKQKYHMTSYQDFEKYPNLKRAEPDLYWEAGLSKLRAYLNKNGDISLPKHFFTQDGFNLYEWFRWHKRKYVRNQLSQHRVEILNKFPGFVQTQVKRSLNDFYQQKWDIGFEKLKEFYKCEGHFQVGVFHKDQDGYQLGRWVCRQRDSYSKGKLSDERVSMLGGLTGWQWSIKDGDWENKYILLRDFVEREGHFDVPRDYSVNGINLGNWVVTQKYLYRQGKLSWNRMKALEKIDGWSWNKSEKKWEKRYKQLCEYYEIEGHVDVPSTCVIEDGFKLGHWVADQRYLRGLGKLSNERKKLLELLPGWTWTAWDKSYRHMQKYCAEFGHALVPQHYVCSDGYKLGIWVMHQRQRYRKKELNAEIIWMLQELPGWMWNVK